MATPIEPNPGPTDPPTPGVPLGRYEGIAAPGTLPDYAQSGQLTPLPHGNQL